MNTSMKNSIALTLIPVGLSALAALSGCAVTNNGGTRSGQKTFGSPEQAVLALGAATGSDDQQKLDELFGKDSAEVLSSGDEVADQQDALKAKEAIAQKVSFEDRDDKTKVAVIGDDAWPFPIPLVKERGGWRFDTEAGIEEIGNRRVGLNELFVLATLHAIVDAQEEYFAGRHDGRTKTYAGRIISSEGKRDGLYWPTPEGRPVSPLGPLVADAEAEGYTPGDNEEGEPEPYHGYFYRILKAQGAKAPGGAKSYVDAKGAMTRGFAVLAYPAKYGSSGVMSFVVDRKGIVFQKDLGEDTEAAAAAITAYEPDDSWNPTAD